MQSSVYHWPQRERYHNGYRQVTILLQRTGWAVNHKRVARIRREDNLLCVPKNRSVRQRLTAA